MPINKKDSLKAYKENLFLLARYLKINYLKQTFFFPD